MLVFVFFPFFCVSPKQLQMLYCTNQLLIDCLSLLPPADLHIDLIASMLQFDLQGSPLSLRFSQPLFTGKQLLVCQQPLFTAILKADCHLKEF